jgi:hypothetical protein
MGWHGMVTSWTGNAVLAGLLGCAGAEQPDPGPAEPSGPAVLVTEIHPGDPSNRPPRFISMAPQLAREGEPYRYGIFALDPDGDEVRFTLLRAPEGAALEGRVLKWIPGHAQVGRPQRFTLRAADGHGGVDEQTWTIIPRAEPHPGIWAEPRLHH